MASADLTSIGAVPLSEALGEAASFALGIALHGKGGVIRAFAMVDLVDYPRMVEHDWHFHASHGGSGYATRSVRKADGRYTQQRMHRELMALEPGDPREVDHINGDKLDNRRANLRVCTHAENLQNLGRHCNGRFSSLHRGVSWDATREKWLAQGRSNYRVVFIGRFDTEEEAAEAAAAWRREHMPFSTN